MNSNIVGLILTGLWIVVLFVGAITSKSQKSELVKGMTIGALVAIPATYMITWLFQMSKMTQLKLSLVKTFSQERIVDRYSKARHLLRLLRDSQLRRLQLVLDLLHNQQDLRTLSPKVKEGC